MSGDPGGRRRWMTGTEAGAPAVLMGEGSSPLGKRAFPTTHTLSIGVYILTSVVDMCDGTMSITLHFLSIVVDIETAREAGFAGLRPPFRRCGSAVSTDRFGAVMIGDSLALSWIRLQRPDRSPSQKRPLGRPVAHKPAASI